MGTGGVKTVMGFPTLQNHSLGHALPGDGVCEQRTSC